MTAKAFDIGEGIFFFFKRVGEKPLAALWIAVWQLGVVAALFALSLYILLPALSGFAELAQLEDASQINMSDAEAFGLVWQVLQPFMAILFLLVPLSILLVVMFQAAWLRFLTRGEVAAVIPFRLGGDEFRLIGVNLLYIVLASVAYVGGIILFAIFGISAVGFIELNADEVAAALSSALVLFIAMLVVIAALIFVAVNLASAPALTVLDRRFRFFESWDATKSVFWHMALVYLVVGTLIIILSTVVSFMVQIALIGAVLPMIQDLILLDETVSDPSVQQVFEVFGNNLLNPGTVIFGGAGIIVAYFAQISFEGMWHGVGAYNACRYRGQTAGEDEGAPVLGADHPAGASPAEG